MSIVLASGSAIRKKLLENANVDFSVNVPRIDEEIVKASLISQNISCWDIADTLADMKAHIISAKIPESLVIGCDQIIEFKGKIISKFDNPQSAKDQLYEMSGASHKLITAAVVYDQIRPVWRVVREVKLVMRNLEPGYIDQYVDRNWTEIQFCAGGYQIEAEGIRLFSEIEGDYFSILGLPLLDLLNYLALRGVIE